MVYWTAGPHQGLRLYKESAKELEELFSKYSNVPLGYSSFAKEKVALPSEFAATIHPLKFYRKHAAGGHFAAWERWVYYIYPNRYWAVADKVKRPEELTADLREFFKGIITKDKKLQDFGASPVA
jgi:hypothetical protein